MSAPTVSAVVCAYTEDRWDDTVAAVESLLTQDPAPAEVLLVIDTNPALAARARERFAGTPCEVTDNRHARGLSGARNTALDRVDGDVVVFLDDDAAARPGWLATLLRHYDDPDVVAVGGRAEPRWPGAAAPACLPEELWWVVGCSYTGQHAADGPAPVRNLMGCAMSFRRSALDEVDGFAESMGRIGTVPLGCEETDLCIRLRQARPSATVLFDPAAVVDHRVTAPRTRWGYLLRRCFSEGLSKAALSRRVGAGDGLAAERGYTRAVLPAALLRELRASAAAAVRARPSAAARHAASAAALPAAVLTAGAGYLRGRAASRPSEQTLLRPALANRRWIGGLLAAAGVVAAVAALLDASSGAGAGVRAVATVVFLMLGPGWAIAGFLRRVTPALMWATAIAVGSALGAIVAQGMVLLSAWHPVGALYLAVALCVPVLVRHAAVTR